ncbi:MAG TPA: leucyl aminopeptidase [Gemmatimonadaceae bacterium]|nr:leucyl aminopeptidase [Gemmatimonadaceae bacterium]
MPLRLSARRAAVEAHETPLLVLAISKGAALPAALRALDEQIGGALGTALESRDFRGGRDETLRLSGVRGAGPQRLLLVGLGDSADHAGAARRAAAVAARQARKSGVTSLAWWSDRSDAAVLEATAVGLVLGAWEYNDLKTPPPEAEHKPELADAVLLVPDDADGTDAVARGAAIGEGMDLARRLAMMPGNMCTPDFLADTAGELAKRFGLVHTVLGRAEMERENMGSFLCVAQGTPQEPKLITLEYKGAAGKPVVLVGKGLCFDTGGISMKPALGMEAMKFDMCGAAGVLGAMLAIAAMKLPVHVVVLIGSTTNMPSGTAVKPGDVVKASNGKTIEIINTDAEGRLVLADILVFAKRFDPAVVIDAATLTGAAVIALGHTATAVLGNDDALIEEIVSAGKRSGELAWPLPLWDDYKELIKSDVADVKNSGGRAAGTITAAMFLKEFVEGFPWAHLDVAGTAYSEGDLTYIPKGPTGIPVGLFVEFVRARAR